jgi:hypothetical protein
MNTFFIRLIKIEGEILFEKELGEDVKSRGRGVAFWVAYSINNNENGV